MKIENEELETTFELPDAPTMRQMLRYQSERDFRAGESTYERLWAAACNSGIVTGWKSVPVPELSMSVLEAEANDDTGRQMDVVKWVGLATFSHMRQIEERTSSKNS